MKQIKSQIEAVCRTLKRDFDPIALRNIILFTLAMGLVVHGYNLFNVDYNHDRFVTNHPLLDRNWKISLGRFMQPVNMWIRGYNPPTTVTGVLSLLYLGVAIYLITLTLQIRQMRHRYALAALFVVSTPYTLTHLSCAHELDMFMLALLSASVAGYLFARFKYGYVAAIPFVVISCGFYQAYIAITIVMAMLLILQQLLDNPPPRTTLRTALRALVMIGVSGVLYVLLYRLVATLTGVDVASTTSYNSIEHAYEAKSLHTLLLTYKEFFIDTLGYLQYFRLYTCAALVAGVSIYLLTSLVIYLRQRPALSLFNQLALLLLLLLLPLGSYPTTFMSNGVNHGLMTVGSFMLYVLLFMVMECPPIARLKVNIGVYLALALLCINGFIYPNTIYQERAVKVENTLHIMHEVYDEVVATACYQRDPHCKVVVVGEINCLAPLNFGSHLSQVITYDEIYWFYFKRHFNADLNLILGEEYAPLVAQRSEAIGQLPSSPYKGVVAEVDGVVVIKFPSEQPLNPVL